MMVLGHGVDLVDVESIRRWIEDPRDPLVSRCFNAEEITEIGEGSDRVERLAGRFAAKEAVLKALGTGYGAGISFKDVVVRRNAGCPPEVVLRGGAASAAAAMGVIDWKLSISHAGGMSIASAIALGVPPQSAHPAEGPR
ncbi:Holo-[acyl-carrier-protein] synthase [Bradyrhizobium ivorense]|uniref:Holo-[acyl-carrier-protein] synthase n=1 Tax=Bradyrhizobium ivorense TaxID=2511166 RepID=A0A508T0D2_9BRAD|nr:holo-ACP synthase [Bradyrhizobium ivorense]VIO68782.1 Holo-[acyl-carrier-protein] synthase [Bradyrhizobium ivorense]